MSSRRKLPGKRIQVRASDVGRFEKAGQILLGTLPLSDDGLRAAATVLAGMRLLQAELGPGHIPFELIAREVPDAYKRNWAKQNLGLVDRR